MLNNSALATAEKVLKTQYNEAIGAIQATNPFIALRQVATVIQSEGSEESYGWLGEMPGRTWMMQAARPETRWIVRPSRSLIIAGTGLPRCAR